MASLWKVAAYDNTRSFVMMIPDFLSLVVTPRHNLPGGAVMVLGISHPAVPVLMADGAQLKFWFKGYPVLSGAVVQDDGTGDGESGTVTFTVEDHKAVLWDVLALPVPTSPIANQTASEFYAATGPAETVLKNLVLANAVNRDGGFPGVSVATDQGRGNSINVSLRFDSVGTVVVPIVEAAGLGVSVMLNDSGSLVVDVYQPGTYPLVFSMATGTLDQVSWTRKRPTATRAFIGGVHTHADRIFQQVTASDLEAAYGFRAETFIDASQTGQMVTDQDTLIANNLSAMNDAYKAYQDAQAAIASPLQSFTDASSKYDAALAKESQADTAEQVAWAAMQGSATGSPLYNAHTTAQNAYSASQTDLNTAYTTQASAQTALTNAQNTAASAKTTYTNAQTAYNNAVNGMAAKVTAHRAELASLGSLKLAEMGPKISLAVKFAETDAFSYGGPDGANVGDVLQITMGDGSIQTDVMRGANITASNPESAVIEPLVGDFSNTQETELWRALADSRKRINANERHQ